MQRLLYLNSAYLMQHAAYLLPKFTEPPIEVPWKMAIRIPDHVDPQCNSIDFCGSEKPKSLQPRRKKGEKWMEAELYLQWFHKGKSPPYTFFPFIFVKNNAVDISQRCRMSVSHSCGRVPSI
ncbi:hypothetical protein CDAR_369471 [Caerostris darwini]|uniref:Uncharacterized protein n=1 Tax=Caerostris darwini TaxID=1538125 RepID=A0AAV4S0U3_9ARAC|nr:hypothetical protein CDAR_369471 [Caerostris darwini]